MPMSNTEQRWGWLAQLFHWGMFLLIVGAWYAVDAHEDFPKGSDERAQWMMIHKALGTSVLFLVWIRLAARFVQRSPVPVGQPLEQKVAAAGNVALYALMIAMPVTGLLATQYSGRPLDWFGVFELPVVLAENKETGKVLMEMHEGLYVPFFALIGVHALAALYHQLVQKDGTLRRMLP